MSPRLLVLMVEQSSGSTGSSLRSAEAVKGLGPLRGSRSEPLTAASLRLCCSLGERPSHSPGGDWGGVWPIRLLSRSPGGSRANARRSMQRRYRVCVPVH